MKSRLLDVAAATTRSVRVRRAISRNKKVISPLLGDADFCRDLYRQGHLPSGYGRNTSERAVEYPWAFGAGMKGHVLDAGATLNHEWVIRSLPTEVEQVTVMTLAKEGQIDDSRLQYQRADLRQIPAGDDSFDFICCLSTLEHVGMDVSGYGISVAPVDDRLPELARVMTEFRRVVRPGGALLFSVPFGSPITVGSMQQFSEETLLASIEAFGSADVEASFFRYASDGWQRSTMKECRDLRYRNRRVELRSSDGAVAARAVACVRLAVV